MNRRKFLQSLVIGGMALAAVGLKQPSHVLAKPYKPPKDRKKTTHAQRKAAAARAKAMGVTSPSQLVPAANAPYLVPDYFGAVPNYANSPLPTVDPLTGAVISGGIRKFVDTLPGLGAAGANNRGQYIPVAVPDTNAFPGSDYYEIELGMYTQQLHTDLMPTTLRGYRQTNTSDPTVSVFSYMGPVIIAQQDRPVRIKFTNNLPVGAGGDLFIPTDTTYMGAGMGPDGMTMYTENRSAVHLHGGNTPWISDGTPHQWTTPAGEAGYQRGLSVQFVPDMWFDPTTHALVPAGTAGATNDPGPGSLTLYYTNQQTARLMFYHDHAYGITRLNVYAGVAAGYLIQDPVERALVAGGTVNGVAIAAETIPSSEIPLIIQDKTFIPDNTTPFTNKMGTFGSQLQAQDPTWPWPVDPTLSNLWFPHVYMPNQNPADSMGANAMGRWDYGPWFWPPYTGLTYGPVANPYFGLPGEPPQIPGTPNPSGVPEGFMDTPLVNGCAYPSITVDAKAYRLRILNACNDRYLNLQLYQATSIISFIQVTSPGSGYTDSPVVTITGDGVGATGRANVDPATGGITSIDVTSVGSGYTTATVTVAAPVAGTQATAAAVIYTAPTEVGMVPSNPGSWPAGWPTPDGRDGGWPDPAKAGPTMIQIGTEGGLLPAPAPIPNRPIGYNYNRRDITVLNVQEKAIFLGPAERADVVVDFSQFAGKTLIVYNDAPAPVPAFDPRNDYYTGCPDNTDTGGAPTTVAGYGPNTRTIMQINVTTNASPAFNVAALNAALPIAFAASQPVPNVPQTIFNPVYSTAIPADAYPASQEWARIQDTSMNISVPSLTVALATPGSGYTAAPAVSFAGSTGVGAAAVATLIGTSVGGLTMTNAGAGYTSAPTVRILNGGGSGATATAALTPTSVATISIINGGKGYKSVPTVTITGGGGSGATATATVRSGVITLITVTNHGTGYTSVPTVTITGGFPSTPATAAAVLTPTTIAGFTLTANGTGYTSAPSVSITGGGGTGAAATAALAPTGVASVTLTSSGSGYFSAPTVTLTPVDGNGTGATATAAVGFSTVNVPLKPKAIQELFTVDYGRMNATFGVEVPNTSVVTQTTIPYGYIDPPTEIFKKWDPAYPIGSDANGIQFWKITHNGVDTHSIHFHLFDVQVVNRVGWDGMVKPPDANECGWKDTVRMNPLEDCIVAMRPTGQVLPWDLPNSIRPMDVTMPATSTNFTNIDPTNEPATVNNDLINFGYEYVWHCHLLGHEENDMMRPMSLGVAPKAPSNLTIALSKLTATLTWVNNAVNATSFTIQRATAPGGPWTTIAVVPAAQLSVANGGLAKKTTYYYRVIANNVLGYTQTYAPPVVGYPHVSFDSAPSNVVTIST